MIDGENLGMKFMLTFKMAEKFTEMIEWARFVHFEGRLDELKNA